MNAVVPAERAAPRPSLTAGGSVAAIIPRTLEETFRLADAMSQSGMAPATLKTPAQVMVAIIAGAELGMPPFQSIQSFAVINGRPSIWGDGLIAVVRSHGFRVREWMEGEGDAMVACCEVTRPDSGEVIPGEFSVGDARKAGLWSKPGPWQTSPKRMLKMRARAFACRDGAADVLRGFQMREEVEDYQPIRETARPAPDLAARLAAPKEGPAEGFTAVHAAPAQEDTIPDFDGSAEDAEPVDDTFPGDREPAEDAKTAGPAEANAVEGAGLAVDVIAWADALIADLPFFTPEQVEHLESDRKELAKFAVLKATDIGKARELEDAITAAKG